MIVLLEMKETFNNHIWENIIAKITQICSKTLSSRIESSILVLVGSLGLNWSQQFLDALIGAELFDRFEKQVSYHFFSASVLLVYEGEPKAERVVSARLVDFAHVLYDQSAVDENFLSGLNVLIQMLSDVIKSVKA